MEIDKIGNGIKVYIVSVISVFAICAKPTINKTTQQQLTQRPDSDQY